MQVLGNKAVIDLANSLASRATRPETAEWVVRTVPRYIRKTTDLLIKFDPKEHSALEKAMEADGLPVEARQRVMVVFKAGEPIYRPNPKALIAFRRRATEVMDWMESLDDRDRRVRRIERMSWPDAEALSKAWHVAVVKRAHNVKGDPSRGARRIAELDGGAYVAELESKSALVLEGRSMDHCVGGYWERVASNRLRIISMRDASGMPAVTIELNRPPKIDIEGLGEIEVAFVPRPGASHVPRATFEWRAGQVRGFANRVPSQKWINRVVSYFTQEGIKWDEHEAPEFLNSHIGTESFLVYSINHAHFLSADKAVEHGNAYVAGQMAKGQHVRATYEYSGLKSIHDAASPDGSARMAFFDTLLPTCVEQLEKRRSKRDSLTKAIYNSGIAYVLSQLGEKAETKREILEYVCKHEDTTFATETKPVVIIAGQGKLELVTHKIPMLSLTLLSHGLLGGIEDEAVTRLKPHFDRVMLDMERRPDCIHAISPIEDGSTPRADILKAFLICGLGERLDRLMSRVGDNIRTARSNIVYELRSSRRDRKIEQETFNRYMNLFADGFEDRIEAMIDEMLPDRPFLITGKRLAPVNRPAPAKPAPMKTFSIPARAKMARR